MTKIALSFDDGRKDNYDNAKVILEKNGLTATFSIATAYIDGSIQKEYMPCINPAMSIENVKELYDSGFEIACHGDSHINTEDDMEYGLEKLRKWLGLSYNDLIGFASPESKMQDAKILSDINKYKDRFLYIRIGIKDANSIIKKLERKFAFKSGNCKLYEKAFEKSIGVIKEKYLVYSIPVMHDASCKQVVCLIEHAVKQNKNCVLMFHSILDKDAPYYSDTWSWDKEKFECLCKWLSDRVAKNILEVCATKDIINM